MGARQHPGICAVVACLWLRRAFHLVIAACLAGCGPKAAPSEPNSEPKPVQATTSAVPPADPSAASTEDTARIPPEALTEPGWLGVIAWTRPKGEGGGVVLKDIEPGSAAARAGLSRGDRLVSIEGHSIESLRDLLHQLDGRQIGSEVQLGVVRGAERLELSVELTGYPGRASQTIQRFIGAPENYWEMKVWLEDGRPAKKGELAGKVTVLMFFGPSCEDCPRVATVLNAWRKRYASRGAKLYGITAQPAAEAKAIARRFGMEFEVLWTRKGSSNLYSVTYFPTVFLIHDEVIRDATFGIYPGEFERMDQTLSELLDERQTP